MFHSITNESNHVPVGMDRNVAVYEITNIESRVLHQLAKTHLLLPARYLCLTMDRDFTNLGLSGG